jgi:hypothetical protein
MDDERELAEATAELAETLEELRTELEGPPRGPLGLPRPPKPAELLRLTEQYTIPTVIALLEASIRSLELLGAALRVADGRPIDAATGRSDLGGRRRLAAASRETLQRLDDALAELQSAARGEPSNPELQRLLDEARDLRAEVDDRLADAVDDSDRPSGDAGSSDSEAGDSAPDEAIGIDVDEELASIKRDVEDRPGDDDPSDGDRNGDENENPESPSGGPDDA